MLELATIDDHRRRARETIVLSRVIDVEVGMQNPPNVLRRQSEVHVALEVKRRHAGIFRVVEPKLRAQVLAARVRRFRQFLAVFGHDFSSRKARRAPYWNGLISLRECAQ